LAHRRRKMYVTRAAKRVDTEASQMREGRGKGKEG